MRFYRSRECDPLTMPAVLWNVANGSAEFEFVKGVFDTEDPALISKLKAMGYSYYDPATKRIMTLGDEALVAAQEDLGLIGNGQPADQAEEASQEEPPDKLPEEKPQPIRRPVKRKPAPGR